MKKYEMIEIQTNIEKIYKEVFGIPDIAEDTNFFEIGGNSILAAKVVQKIKTCLGINLAIQDIFEYVTVNLLISYIAKIYNEKTKMEEERYCNEETKEAFELTEIQKAYLIGRQGITGEGKVASHYYVELECETVDILRLEEAWNVVVVRQPALRTIIDVKAMKQKILTRVQDYKIELLDFEEDLKGFYELRRDMEDQVLDISRWPVFDIRVSKLKDKFRIHVSMDNMILDGTAICAVLDEWNKLYKGEVLKSDIGKKTFKDYVNYLKTLELSSEYSMAQEYWNKKIVNMPPRPELPLLNKNVNGEFYRLSTVLQKEKWNVLKMLSAKYGITPSNVLLTSFSEVLYRWGKENKFTINLTINKKALLDSGYAKVLGEFTDTILVEVNAGKKRNFIEKCKSIQNELLNNLKYSSYNGVAVQRDWTKEHGFLMGTAFPIVFTSLLGTADLLDIPYGYPLTNQKYYVMNADGLICPDNVPGELCIAGEGLAKEYVNDKKLTIEKFQYNEDIEQRIYKTGDRGVCVEGCIWYLGREDTQIKRRGYRIELGEIESILNSVTGIKASKVVYKDSQLLAFVVPEQDFSWEISDIETIIKGKLPQFNLPDSITILERFPENINGKIDMAKLCDYANNKIETKERLENNIEKQIAEVWRRILGLKETIIYDVDFFQCGGNSLKAVEVIAEINHLFQGLELEIKDLFLNSTIKKISLKVEDELKKFMIVEEGTI